MDSVDSAPPTVSIARVVSVIGALSLLAGLVWDARLHAADADLAAREGVLSLENPAHLLTGVGVVLVTLGVTLWCWTSWFRCRSLGLRAVGAVALLLGPVVAAGAAAVSAQAEAGAAAGHHHASDGGEAAELDEGKAPAEHDDEAAHTHEHERDYDALWAAATAEERVAATRLADDTRAATARYADHDAALAAGYRPSRQGDNVTHYPNPSLMRDGRVLDPSAPESLFYWNSPGGEKVLVGAIYKAAPGEEAPAPGGALTRWHTHAGTTRCYPAEDPSCPQDTMKMLHVFFFEGVVDPFTEHLRAAAGR